MTFGRDRDDFRINDLSEGRKLLLNEPEALLTLSLSVSAKSVTRRKQIHRNKKKRKAILLCTKETIALALNLQQEFRRYGSREFESVQRDIDSRIVNLSRYYQRDEFYDPTGLTLFESQRFIYEILFNRVLRDFPLGSYRYPDEVFSNLRRSFHILESNKWVVDPGFMVEPQYLLVLFGLVPMQFSLRTKAGEKVYREIKIAAPLWKLSITNNNLDGINQNEIRLVAQ